VSLSPRVTRRPVDEILERPDLRADRLASYGSGQLRARLPGVVVVALVFLAGVDLPTRVGGSTSLSAVATLGYAAVVVLLLPSVLLISPRPRNVISDLTLEPALRRGASLPLAAWLFLAGASASVVAVSFSKTAIQNLCVYALFVGMVALTADMSSKGTYRIITQALVIIGGLLACAYAADVALNGFGAATVFGRRSFALVALIIQAFLTPARLGRIARFTPVVLLGMIVLSGSRTAMAAGAMVFVGRALRTNGLRRTVRMLSLAAAVAGAAFLLVTRSATLRERFVGGDRAFAVAGVSVNSEGRSKFWEVTWQSSKGARFTGRGAGTAQDVVRARFGGIGHPHNDYLRLMHDFGGLGLVLWLLAYGALVIGTLRRARRRSSDDAAVHWGACLALLALAACMITDNVIVYPFVMAPLGMLVGLSYAYPIGDSHTAADSASRERSPLDRAPRPRLPAVSSPAFRGARSRPLPARGVAG
jgi:O-antigen ligase